MRNQLRALACATTAVLAILAFSAAPLLAQSSNIVKVVEEWELKVKSPDNKTNSPQVTCLFSPNGHVEGVHASLELNYQGLPEYTPGGLQLQTWDGDYDYSSRKFPGSAVMNTENETVTWKQSITVGENAVRFEIFDGSSVTWGNFGGQGYLRETLTWQGASLNNYDPLLSVKQSGPTFGGNRVEHLTLKKVTLIYANGHVAVDHTDRVAWPLESGN